MSGYTVELALYVEESSTPEEAVEEFISTITKEGMHYWAYKVTDDDGVVTLVDALKI